LSQRARVEVLPVVADDDEDEVRAKVAREDALRVGCIGAPYTWQGLAQSVHKVLNAALAKQDEPFLAVRSDAQLEAVGALKMLP